MSPKIKVISIQHCYLPIKNKIINDNFGIAPIKEIWVGAMAYDGKYRAVGSCVNNKFTFELYSFFETCQQQLIKLLDLSLFNNKSYREQYGFTWSWYSPKTENFTLNDFYQYAHQNNFITYKHGEDVLGNIKKYWIRYLKKPTIENFCQYMHDNTSYIWHPSQINNLCMSYTYRKFDDFVNDVFDKYEMHLKWKKELEEINNKRIFIPQIIVQILQNDKEIKIKI